MARCGIRAVGGTGTTGSLSPVAAAGISTARCAGSVARGIALAGDVYAPLGKNRHAAQRQIEFMDFPQDRGAVCPVFENTLLLNSDCGQKRNRSG